VGDNKENAPIPKGQNLYNIYENRSYSATITGLGNAMIQPTHYFQLENVPLFNGAYIILDVEHDISPNKMTTTFTGTKILRFPIPRVKDPAVIFGVGDIGSYSTTNFVMLGDDIELMDDEQLEKPLRGNLVIRNDNGGQGHWGASRKITSKNRGGQHYGVDFKTTPGEPILSPIDGTLQYTYNESPNVSITPQTSNKYFKSVGILYVHRPQNRSVGQSYSVKVGDVIGYAANLQEKEVPYGINSPYGKIVGHHIHVQLITDNNGSKRNPTPFFRKHGIGIER
jgi:hypothetical protein